mgnify:FL=1
MQSVLGRCLRVRPRLHPYITQAQLWLQSAVISGHVSQRQRNTRSLSSQAAGPKSQYDAVVIGGGECVMFTVSLAILQYYTFSEKYDSRVVGLWPCKSDLFRQPSTVSCSVGLR